MSESTAEPTAAPPGDGSGDAAAQQMLADAVASGQFLNPQKPAAPSQAEPPTASNGGQAEETDWEAEATKWKSLARKHENQHLSALGFKSKDEIDQLRQAAEKYREFEDAQKSEIQRATDKATGLEKQLADLQSANARLMAAATHNIPPDLIDLLGTGTDDEINTRAEALAERLKATAPAPAPATQRPVESLTPGAAPASAKQASADDWIRQLAGRRTP